MMMNVAIPPLPGEHPCEFDCEICGVDDDMKTATPSNAKAVTVAGVQAMIDALPDVEDVRKGNAEKVKAQLDAIDDAKAELLTRK